MKACYSIQDLSSLTGIKVRTIKFYIHRGIVQKAYSRNTYAYGPEHLQRLHDIQRILEGNRTIDDLRDYFNPEDADK